MIAYNCNYPVLPYRDDEVDDVPDIVCNFDSYSDFLSRTHLLRDDCVSLLVVNIRSCHSNFDQLIVFLKSIAVSFSLIFLTETWVSDECKDMYVIDDYDCFCVSRGGRGGGVMAFCQSSLAADTVEEFSYVSPVIDVLPLLKCCHWLS